MSGQWNDGHREVGCYTWDGWLGKCTEYYPASWWEYVNVWSILAGFVGVAVLITLLSVLSAPVFSKVSK